VRPRGEQEKEPVRAAQAPQEVKFAFIGEAAIPVVTRPDINHSNKKTRARGAGFSLSFSSDNKAA
jgi:hypothetical protein